MSVRQAKIQHYLALRNLCIGPYIVGRSVLGMLICCTHRFSQSSDFSRRTSNPPAPCHCPQKSFLLTIKNLPNIKCSEKVFIFGGGGGQIKIKSKVKKNAGRQKQKQMKSKKKRQDARYRGLAPRYARRGNRTSGTCTITNLSRRSKTRTMDPTGPPNSPARPHPMLPPHTTMTRSPKPTICYCRRI